MKDEYLWYKTGEDPEIEKLEKALAVFRYRAAAPIAAVPQNDVSPERPARFRISFALAFASLAIVAIVTAVWIRISNTNSRPENSDEIVFVQESTDAPDAGVSAEPRLQTAPNRESHDRPAGSRRRTITGTSAAIRRRPKTKDSAPSEGIAKLTKEEQFAYRQLMLALSITSSKLKIVQDTIDGTEVTEDTESKNQR